MKMIKKRAKTYRYKCGDIFRVRFDDKTYGYGIIVSKIVPLIKLGIIPENHPFRLLMDMPILIRLYDLVTEDKKVTLEKLLETPYKKTMMMSDWGVHRGIYPVILHKELTSEDIDFPIYCGVHAYHSCFWLSKQYFYNVLQDGIMNDMREDSRAYFSWGIGIIKKQGVKFEKSLKNIDDKVLNKLLFDRENFPHTRAGIVKEDLNDKQHTMRYFSNILKYFDVPLKITFDEFNKRYNGYTKEEFLEIIKKYKL